MRKTLTLGVLPLCVSASHACLAPTEGLGAVDLELETLVNCHVDAGTDPRSLARIASVLTCSPLSPAQSLLLFRGPELSSSNLYWAAHSCCNVSCRGSDHLFASVST